MRVALVTGAGKRRVGFHVAEAFARRGWAVAFVGEFEGLAAWLIERAGREVLAPADGLACGLDPARWSAAIVDSYTLGAPEVCVLAGQIPVVTLGEATRCEEAGILIDYHLDRAGQVPTSRLLPGPAYAPIDPAFAGAGRAGREVEAVLITVGGSERALRHVEALQALVARAFPEAEQIVPRGGPGAAPVRLIELVGRVDLAVTAAGLTAYELACAGVPQVAVAIVENQRRVAEGLRRTGLSDCVDVYRGEALEALTPALERLADPGERQARGRLGRSIFDGGGADRAAGALLVRWTPAGSGAATIRSP